MREFPRRLPLIVALATTLAAACVFSLGGCIDPDPGKPPLGETATGDGGGNGGGTGGETGGGGGDTPDTTAPQATADPESGARITDSSQIVISFSEVMDPASLSLTGNMVNLGLSGWNTAGDVLTVSPISVWPEGPNQGLAIDAGDLAGNPLITLVLNYTVDATAPTVAAAVADGSAVDLDAAIAFTFDEEMASDSEIVTLGGSVAEAHLRRVVGHHGRGRQ